MEHTVVSSSPAVARADGSATATGHSTVPSQTEDPAAPIRIAYLLLGHHQPALVAQTVRYLTRDPHARVFIHIDRKIDIAPFRRGVQSSRAVFIRDRVTVQWGGWSIVAATINLLRAATTAGVPFDYFQLLSDSCFPIKSTAFIQQKLRPRVLNFITINEALTNASPFYWWIAQYHCADLLPLNTFERYRVANWLRILFSKVVPRRLPPRITPYKGWQWWCLNAACVQYMLQFIDENPSFVRFYRRTRIPDEMFFHTIVVNSPFVGTLCPGFSEGSITGNHYVAWESGRPVELREEHLDVLLATNACFARKFHEAGSAPLLAALIRALERSAAESDST